MPLPQSSSRACRGTSRYPATTTPIRNRAIAREKPVTDRRFYVYILSNVSRTLYIGFTNDIQKRVWQHRQKQADGFTRDYNITMLVHIEEFARADNAIAREKQLKNWRRDKKIWLIERENPTWLDLAHDWF